MEPSHDQGTKERRRVRKRIVESTDLPGCCNICYDVVCINCVSSSQAWYLLLCSNSSAYVEKQCKVLEEQLLKLPHNQSTLQKYKFTFYFVIKVALAFFGCFNSINIDFSSNECFLLDQISVT